MPKSETASLSTDSSDTFPSPACSSIEIPSGRRLAWPRGPAKKFSNVLVLDQNLEMRHAVGVLSPQGGEEAVLVGFAGKRFDARHVQ